MDDWNQKEKIKVVVKFNRKIQTYIRGSKKKAYHGMRKINIGFHVIDEKRKKILKLKKET